MIERIKDELKDGEKKQGWIERIKDAQKEVKKYGKKWGRTNRRN